MEPKPTPREPIDPRRIAKEVLRAEAAAVASVVDRLDERFDRAVELILGCTGSVIVAGLGKSGLVGQKISATMSSIGTPSHYLHATEAAHGDLGRVRPGDIAVLLSFSGQTEEVVSLAGLLHHLSVPFIAITGPDDSQLARLADAALCIGRLTEVCPHNLAPTSSTTAMMALGDALALAVSRARAFSIDDYRKRHPGGALGRRMLPIASVMRAGKGDALPIVRATGTLAEVLQQAETGARRAGALLLTDDAGVLVGILTDADIRRRLVADGPSVLDRSVTEVMTHDPRRLSDTHLVNDAVELIRTHRLDEIPVVDADGKPVGLVDVQDLIALRLVEENER